MAKVASLDITTVDHDRGLNQPRLVAYSVPLNSSNPDSQLFLGPRSIISRLSTATATQGGILPIDPPFENASYALQFYGPIVTCDGASSTISSLIDKYVEAFVSSSHGPT